MLTGRMLTDLHSPTPENTAPAARRATSSLDIPAGTDNQLHAITTACGVSALDNRSKLLISGEDRTRWLNGMVTNNVRDLAPEHGVYAFLLNAQGRIQGDLYAFNRDANIVLDVDRSQTAKLTEILDRFIVMDDVTIEDITHRFSSISVQGPNARAVLQAIALEAPELEPLQLAQLSWRGHEIALLRSELWKGETYEIWLAPEHASALLDALTQAGAAHNGPDAERLYRIASGIPLFGEDIRERDLPQETGQERALHFAKGCYVGQEIVERIRSRGQVHRVFSGFELSASCTPGDKIEADGKEVGEITSTAVFRGLRTEDPRIIGLGYLRREAFNKTLTVHGAPVQRHELPFQKLLQA